MDGGEGKEEREEGEGVSFQNFDAKQIAVWTGGVRVCIPR